jgi:hypothetical protein
MGAAGSTHTTPGSNHHNMGTFAINFATIDISIAEPASFAT